MPQAERLDNPGRPSSTAIRPCKGVSASSQTITINRMILLYRSGLVSCPVQTLAMFPYRPIAQGVLNHVGYEPHSRHFTGRLGR
jgi:hypothetical protein